MTDPAKLRHLYDLMLRIRRVEEKIVELYPEQEMRCPVHLCIGQEAAAAGTCAALETTDQVFSTHRSHGHYLAKGGNLRAMMAEIYGKATGCCQGKGGSMHLVDLSVGYMGSTPIVGSSIPIGVGAALAGVMQGRKRVTTVFFGEGATEEGVFHESVNFAVLKKLPVVFVCENNLYSVYSPMSVRQPDVREVYSVAQGHGIECHQGSGNDVAEVYALALRAVQKAREGGGPSFLELKTYRWREHCGPNYDNDLGYRTVKEYEEWRKLCPLEAFERVYRGEGVVTEGQLREIRERIDREIADAVSFAKSSPFPEEKQLWQGIYA
jgi:TPP-dependent pyruvate/acetoin dehydrogenase alpha subunit